MAYSITYTNRFKKDLKRCKKRGLDITKIQTVIQALAASGSLPNQYRPHLLNGDHADEWECHIGPDWLMTWKQNNKELTLLFLQTGTHSDVF